MLQIELAKTNDKEKIKQERRKKKLCKATGNRDGGARGEGHGMKQYYCTI